MESEEGVPSTDQQPESMAAEEGAQEGPQEGPQTAAQQPEPVGVQKTSPNTQQPEPQGAEGVEPTTLLQPEPILANESAPATARNPETKDARDGRRTFAQHLDPTGPEAEIRNIFRSLLSPPILHTLPVNQPPLPQDTFQGSASDSSSDWLGYATFTTKSSTVSIHSKRARHNGHIQRDRSENRNRTGRNGTPQQHMGSPKESEPFLTTGEASRQDAAQTDKPHGNSSGNAPVSRKDFSVTTISSTASSGSDPTKTHTLGSRKTSILDIDEEKMDKMTFLTHLMNLLQFYSDYFEGVKQLQAEEYIMPTIKHFVEIGSTSTADMYSIAREVFDSSDETESTDRSSPSQMMEEEVERPEAGASLSHRLQAVRDYVETTSDTTTEAAIADMIIQEYIAEIRMAKSGVLPNEGSPITQETSSEVVHDVEVQDAAVEQGGETYCDSDGATYGVKEVPVVGTSAEETDAPVQTASRSVKCEREFEAEEAVGGSSVKIGTTKEESGKSRTFSSCYSNVDRLEYITSICRKHFPPESNLQEKIHKSHRKAVMLKMSSLAQARVCVLRTMNWVMLRCFKMVTTIVGQALEANRVAHRAILEAEALRSAGTSGDYIDDMAEAATIASDYAEKAVIGIEVAVQLHKLVVNALNLNERALVNLRTETCNVADLIRHLFLSEEVIELQVTRACRMYLDHAKHRDSSDSDSSPVFRKNGGLHSHIVGNALDNIEDGPLDVFQVLIFASRSSINAIEMMEDCLCRFSITKDTPTYF